MPAWPLFLLLGIGIGAVGTLIGAGGGFLLVPILLVLYPNNPPETITAISLAVVFMNAFSGSIAYIRMKRVDFRSGLVFAAAAMPGALLGVWLTQRIPRSWFDAIFGLALSALAVTLLRTPVHHLSGKGQGDVLPVPLTAGRWALGIAISMGVGLVSSVLGIGGGIIHVPALTFLLGFSPHIATATSHFILAILTLGATLEHAAAGHLTGQWAIALCIGAGALIGAQGGAVLSKKIHGGAIIRLLALALLLLGGRLLWSAALHLWEHGLH